MLQIVRGKKNVELFFIMFFHVYANTLHTSILNLIVPHHRLEVACIVHINKLKLFITSAV